MSDFALKSACFLAFLFLVVTLKKRGLRGLFLTS